MCSPKPPDNSTFSLRDYFAAQALAGSNWHEYRERLAIENGYSFDEGVSLDTMNFLLADQCYEIADAMLEVRSFRDD